MKKDILFILFILLIFLPFILIPELYAWYLQFNADHALIMAFLKFGILATAGEMLGLRIKTGNYNEKGFGILPRAIVWGVLGMGISMAMTIFSKGTPAFLASMGLDILSEDFFIRLLVAFSISVTMNCFFAPVFMTFHKITDMHILDTGGTVKGFFSKAINMAQSFKNINWDVQWGFVFKKTIPFFWFPAHTITFMLPGEFRVLFAALLGVALGIILSIAAVKGRK